MKNPKKSIKKVMMMHETEKMRKICEKMRKIAKNGPKKEGNQNPDGLRV